ncbi:hypothetical protein F5Y11DRAFT_358351 [Daldinia sp. FL1419]|nr:hypothetical protein F5Y11DRAFT_358351 [Daldinia sp. FL1419]
MTSLAPIITSILFLYATPCLAGDPGDNGNELPVPEDFPKAFITAMAVAIVSVVLLLTLVCVLAHCWQHILGRQMLTTSTGVPERWLDPVFEWPQQLRPRSRNNYNYSDYITSHRQRRKNRRRLRDRIRMSMVESGWGGKGVGVGRRTERAELLVGGANRNMGW